MADIHDAWPARQLRQRNQLRGRRSQGVLVGDSRAGWRKEMGRRVEVCPGVLVDDHPARRVRTQTATQWPGLGVTIGEPVPGLVLKGHVSRPVAGQVLVDEHAQIHDAERATRPLDGLSPGRCGRACPWWLRHGTPLPQDLTVDSCRALAFSSDVSSKSRCGPAAARGDTRSGQRRTTWYSTDRHPMSTLESDRHPMSRLARGSGTVRRGCRPWV